MPVKGFFRPSGAPCRTRLFPWLAPWATFSRPSGADAHESYHAPDGLPHIVIRRGRNGAGIQHHQVGDRTVVGHFQTLSRELRFQRGAIGLRGPASEILNEVSPHPASIVSY